MNKKKKAARQDFEVGYGKPPVQTRFQKGRSGNPSGRRKTPNEAKSLKRVIRDCANKMVSITIDGKKQLVPMTEAIVLRLTHGALSGDLRSTKYFMELVSEYGSPTPLLSDLMAGRSCFEFTPEERERFDKAKFVEAMVSDIRESKELESKGESDVDRTTEDDNDDGSGQSVL